MISNKLEHLRILVANEVADRLDLVADTVIGLGHDVIAREIDVKSVGSVTAREQPDVALVGLGSSTRHALELIDQIVREATCPVIVLLHKPDPQFVEEASKRGVFAHISSDDVQDWQSAISIVLRRFADYHNLKDALERRGVIERAKGILMERHSFDEDAAFEMLRTQSQQTNSKLTDIAAGIVTSHRLLPGHSKPPNPGP